MLSTIIFILVRKRVSGTCVINGTRGASLRRYYHIVAQNKVSTGAICGLVQFSHI